MKRKVLIFHDYTGKQIGDDSRSLDEKINQTVEKKWPGWFIVSANTAVSTSTGHNGHTYVQWCATVVIEEEKKKK